MNSTEPPNFPTGIDGTKYVRKLGSNPYLRRLIFDPAVKGVWARLERNVSGKRKRRNDLSNIHQFFEALFLSVRAYPRLNKEVQSEIKKTRCALFKKIAKKADDLSTLLESQGVFVDLQLGSRNDLIGSEAFFRYAKFLRELRLYRDRALKLVRLRRTLEPRGYELYLPHKRSNRNDNRLFRDYLTDFLLDLPKSAGIRVYPWDATIEILVRAISGVQHTDKAYVESRKKQLKAGRSG